MLRRSVTSFSELVQDSVELDEGPFEAEVRIRYRGNDVPAVISPGTDETIGVEFRSPQRSVAPGQSVVVYHRDRLLGGARIVHAFR